MVEDHQPTEPKTTYNQQGQTITGPQWNVAGNLNIALGSVLLAVVAFIALAMVIADFAFNLVDRISGLSATGLWITSGVIGAVAWGLSILVLRAHNWVGRRKVRKKVYTFTGVYRQIAKVTAWGIPTLAVTAVAAYYIWRILPAQQTTILVADFVAPSGTDEARVTEILVNEIRNQLTEIEGLRVKRLDRVIDLEGGSDEAMRIGEQPQHKATVVIWGNYAIVNGDPEVHVHFDIVKPVKTYLGAGFEASYGPNQIEQLLQADDSIQLLQIDHPTMFDFKFPLGEYLGQMAAFTLGLTLFESNHHEEAISLLNTAGKAVKQPLAAELERAIRFYRGTNYMKLDRLAEAVPDLEFLVTNIAERNIVDNISLAALGNLGTVLQKQGDYELSRFYHELSFELHKELENSRGMANALADLGLVASSQSDYELARSYHEQALALYRKSGDALGEANQLGNLGTVLRNQGDYEAARSYLWEAFTLHRELEYRIGEAKQLGNLALIALTYGDYEVSRYYLNQSLTLHRELGNPLDEAASLGNLGLLARKQGDYEASRSYHEQALSLHKEQGHLLGEANQLGNLGLVSRRQGDYEAARSFLKDALTLHTDIGNLLGQANQLGNLGLVALDQGNYEAARYYNEQALTLQKQLGNPLGEASVLANLGRLHLAIEESHQAREYLTQSAKLFQSIGLDVHPAVIIGLQQLDQLESTE